MGCLKLTYDYQEQGEKNYSLRWRVWVNPESSFLGVVDQQTQGNCPTGDCDPWAATKAALGIAVTTSAADGPLPVGEIVGAVVITGAVAADLYKRQPNGTQYSLRATRSGLYPVYSWGSATPTGTMYLNAGDIWKIGETIQYDPNSGRQWRYSQTYLDGLGVRFFSEYEGPKAEIIFVQQMKLAQYLYGNGYLPAGNKGLK